MWNRVTRSALFALVVMSAPVVGAHADPMTVPANLNVPEQHVTLFGVLATGTQIYVCKPRASDPASFEWTFKAPDAELWNEQGEKVGTHYAGPTWEANDGSKIVADVVERTNAPDAGAIPWLLLKAKTTEGAGALSTVTYIQRLDTVGGVAPTDGCDQSAANTERAVEYRARYTFSYTAAGS